MQQKIKSLLLSYKSSNALTINILSPFPVASNKLCPFSDNAEYAEITLEYCVFKSLFKFAMTTLSFFYFVSAYVKIIIAHII